LARQRASVWGRRRKKIEGWYNSRKRKEMKGVLWGGKGNE